jgi:hypothetical protein
MRSIAAHVIAALFLWVLGAAPSIAREVLKASASDDALIGVWAGSLPERSVAGDNQGTYFEIGRRFDGGLKASFGIALSTGQFAESVTLRNSAVKIVSTSSQLYWEGTLGSDGKSMNGRFVIGQWSRPLALKKVDTIPGPPRPQTPHGPYPYRVREVRYRNEAAQITLAGTLTLPREGGPFPVVLLICGSGYNDRNCDALYHRPFAVLADCLTRQGIAVLRVDKRGVGESEGNWATSWVVDFAGDALAGLKYLSVLPEIDAKRMGLLGISEGGMVAPMAATMSPDVSFVVSMAGPAMKWFDLIVLQDGAEAIAAGATEKEAALIRAWSTRYYTIARDAKNLDEARKALEELKRNRTDEEVKAFKYLGDVGSLNIDNVLEPNLRNCLSLDPGQYLAKLKCPILVIFGEKDSQVPSKPNLIAAEDAFRVGGNKDATAIELPGVNHCMMRCKTGAPSEYAQIEETISPDALKLVGDWIKGHATKR